MSTAEASTTEPSTTEPSTTEPSTTEPKQKWRPTIKQWLLIFGVVYVGGFVALVAATGWKTHRSGFQPQNEFKLDSWVNLGIFSINKAVLYLVLAATLTCATMLYISSRMKQRPNKVQTLVETVFSLAHDNIVFGNMDRKMAAKWFPFIGTLFFFILYSNLIGYIPLPTNTENEINVLGAHIPAFSLYAATANLSIPLVLALTVFVSYTVEGIRAKGVIGYLKSFIPAGVTGGMKGFIFVLEGLSNLMRIISLSVRLFANVLAGHLIILFMAGALSVILGIAALTWITLPLGIALFAFEVGLVAALQAFIFATLTAIYIGGAASQTH